MSSLYSHKLIKSITNSQFQIKHSKIPVICMCNDRNHPKIRSLSNYCFDLRFQRPRVDQIKVFKIEHLEGRFKLSLIGFHTSLKVNWNIKNGRFMIKQMLLYFKILNLRLGCHDVNMLQRKTKNVTRSSLWANHWMQPRYSPGIFVFSR